MRSWADTQCLQTCSTSSQHPADALTAVHTIPDTLSHQEQRYILSRIWWQRFYCALEADAFPCRKQIKYPCLYNNIYFKLFHIDFFDILKDFRVFHLATQNMDTCAGKCISCTCLLRTHVSYVKIYIVDHQNSFWYWTAFTIHIYQHNSQKTKWQSFVENVNIFDFSPPPRCW